MRTELGKIEKVSFGLGGYQDACIGLNVTLSGNGWGVGSDRTAWDANKIKRTERCEWTEADRDQQYAEILRYVSDLLAAAKIDSVDQLRGKPIEATFDGMTLKEWRILTEVL